MSFEVMSLIESHVAAQSSWRTWAGFASMCIGMFMAILDIQIVATSLPVIQSALEIPPDQMSWIQTAYLIAEVIAIPLTGYLTRVFTMRGLFLIAVSLFTVASAGCAFSSGYDDLIFWRVMQGFSGGAIIPLVFSAVFIMFKGEQIAYATMIAGVSAVIAPTLGPILGGWITQTYSWQWLFLLNITPGFFVFAIAATLIPRDEINIKLLRDLDWISLTFLILGLATFEIALKQGPKVGWFAAETCALFAVSALSGFSVIRRCLLIKTPLLRVGIFADRNFAIASTLSFALGAGLFSSIYLMPIFLGFVRQHGPIEIGTIMLVTGMAQLVTAPIAVHLERKISPSIMTIGGFLVFALGLGLSAFQTPAADYDEMFWPQILRGGAIMFCLLPPTTIALSCVSADRIPDASALFNLMRNLGGAVGIALVDTIIWQRVSEHTSQLANKLATGDRNVADYIGLPANLWPQNGAMPDGNTLNFAQPLLQKAGFTMAINEAWMVMAVLAFSASIAVFFLRKP